MTSTCSFDYSFDLSFSWSTHNNDLENQLILTEHWEDSLTWADVITFAGYEWSPLQLPDRCCGDAHIPEALDWRWKQHMSLSWWCFVVMGIVQLRYWHAIVGDRIPKTRTGRVRKPQWGEFPFHFSGLWKIFKQGRIHMENHLPMTCWLLHSDPRHQEVNNILYKHWIVTKKIT